METENKKILLVEDDPNFGTVLKDYLAMNDYEVTHAKNGMEGFEKFKKENTIKRYSKSPPPSRVKRAERPDASLQDEFS